MKIISSASFIFLAFFSLFFPSKECSSQVNDKEILKKMEYDWLMAEFRLDTAAIALMMDEKFMAIGLTSVSNKREELNGIYEHMSQRKKNNHVVDSLYLDDLHIEIFENTAIVTFISVTKGRINDIPFANRRTRMYDVWIKRKGKWKAVSSKVSPIR